MKLIYNHLSSDTNLTKMDFRALKKRLDERYPVVGYKVYKGGVIKPQRAFYVNESLADEKEQGGGDRQEITEFSSKARANMAFYLLASDTDWKSMLTVTYGDTYPKDGGIVKRHRDRILKTLRYRFPECSYFWFLEFQRRGAPMV